MVQLVSKKLDSEKCKAWKETIVSPALQRGDMVDYFAVLDDLLSMLDIEAEYVVSRESFEEFAYQYLCGLPNLVNGCLKAAGMTGKDVEFDYENVLFEILENGNIKLLHTLDNRNFEEGQREYFSGSGDWYDWINIHKVVVPHIVFSTPVAVGLKKMVQLV